MLGGPPSLTVAKDVHQFCPMHTDVYPLRLQAFEETFLTRLGPAHFFSRPRFEDLLTMVQCTVDLQIRRSTGRYSVVNLLSLAWMQNSITLTPSIVSWTKGEKLTFLGERLIHARYKKIYQVVRE